MKNEFLLKTVIFTLCLSILITGCAESESLSFESVRDFDFKKSLQLSKELNKPLLIYFTGYGCVNCRKMEENHLINNKVKKIINSNYIFVPLYVDDRTIADEKFWVKSVLNDKICKSVGNINVNLQIEFTQQGSQPIFAIFEKEEFTSKTMGYTSDVSNFLKYLNDNKGK